MNIFIQGMRRSGTTVFFDLFWEDGRFDCYYEPFAAAKTTSGGGSGAHSVDFFEKVRSIREGFIANFDLKIDPGLLNYGAPRAAALEFEADLPDYAKEYIRFIISQAADTLVKFTRMHSKVKILHEVDPTAKLIHVVRDPRAVTTSYLFGKNQRNRHKFPNEEAFFGRASTRSSWSSYAFSEYLLDTPEYSGVKGCKDFERILIIWKYKVMQTHLEGARLFGKNYSIIHHEDLLFESEKTIRKLYSLFSKNLPQAVLDWGAKNIRPQMNCYSPTNKNWRKAFDKIDLWESLELTGYKDVIHQLSAM